jgi:hypothetical protein
MQTIQRSIRHGTLNQNLIVHVDFLVHKTVKRGLLRRHEKFKSVGRTDRHLHRLTISMTILEAQIAVDPTSQANPLNIIHGHQPGLR